MSVNMKFVLKYFAVAVFLGMALRAHGSPQVTSYDVHEQDSLQQTGSSSFSIGYDPIGGAFVDQYSLVASVDTQGADLSAAPILGFPNGGSVTFPAGASFSPTVPTGNGYNKYQWGAGWTSQALLNTQYGSGAFTFTLGNATATPTLSLNTLNPVFPISPLLTSGGTWSGGVLLIDPTVTNVLTFNTASFTDYAAATGSDTSGAQIKLEIVDSNLAAISPPSVSQNGLGKSNPAITSYTITAGSLAAGQTYNFQANYTVYNTVNNTNFTGTGISGDPIGVAGYLTTTFISIQTIPEPSTWALLAMGCVGVLIIRFRRVKV
jgi:hypothetical protein